MLSKIPQRFRARSNKVRSQRFKEVQDKRIVCHLPQKLNFDFCPAPHPVQNMHRGKFLKRSQCTSCGFIEVCRWIGRFSSFVKMWLPNKMKDLISKLDNTYNKCYYNTITKYESSVLSLETSTTQPHGGEVRLLLKLSVIIPLVRWEKILKNEYSHPLLPSLCRP